MAQVKAEASEVADAQERLDPLRAGLHRLLEEDAP
jgi:hypothetical protein